MYLIFYIDNWQYNIYKNIYKKHCGETDYNHIILCNNIDNFDEYHSLNIIPC